MDKWYHLEREWAEGFGNALGETYMNVFGKNIKKFPLNRDSYTAELNNIPVPLWRIWIF